MGLLGGVPPFEVSSVRPLMAGIDRGRGAEWSWGVKDHSWRDGTHGSDCPRSWHWAFLHAHLGLHSPLFFFFSFTVPLALFPNEVSTVKERRTLVVSRRRASEWDTAPVMLGGVTDRTRTTDDLI